MKVASPVTGIRDELFALFLFILFAIIAALLSYGFYDSLRSGVLIQRYGTSRRAEEPISYWFGMFVVGLAFLFAASGTVVLGYSLVLVAWGP